MLSDRTPGRAPAASAAFVAGPLVSAIVASETIPDSRSTAPRRRAVAPVGARAARAPAAVTDDSERAGPAPPAARVWLARELHRDSAARTRRPRPARDRPSTRSAI